LRKKPLWKVIQDRPSQVEFPDGEKMMDMLIRFKSTITEVIKGLQNELDIRRKSNQMEFMQNLDTWLNQHTWEKYISIDAGEHEQSQSGHRITRKL
jgi:hypothetical protein